MKLLLPTKLLKVLRQMIKRYIGLSLSLCMGDILDGKVDVNDIACIVTSTAFKSVDEAVEVYYDSYWNTVPKVQVAYLLRGIWPIIAQPRLYSPVIHRGHMVCHGHWVDTIDGKIIKTFDK